MAAAEVETDRTTWSADELLASDDRLEPLFAGGVRCHGGFDAEGRYRSPRTRFRAPAIRAWQSRLAAEGDELIEIPRALMPPQYPNVEQAKLLLRHGVRDPIVRTLTIISIVEGFGAVIRDVPVPDLPRLVVEPIEGTALAHLAGGLFEAHARDEAGYRDEGGHKQMWEAARDVALENPKVPPDVLMRMLGRGGRGERRERSFPEIDEALENLLSTMVNVLAVEVFAAGTFDWGERLLGDPEVSADPQRAGELVRMIRSDESPHVEYLRTALSELRARTLRDARGGTLPGRRVVDGLLQRSLSGLTRSRPREQRDDVRANLKEAMGVARDPAALLAEFDALETAWAPPERTGFEPAEGAAAPAA
jgi:hypothetical protein